MHAEPDSYRLAFAHSEWANAEALVDYRRGCGAE